MRTVRSLVASALAATVVAAMAPPARAACIPAKAGPNRASLSASWKSALDELLAASANVDSPWGCHGGTVDLVEREGFATLTVTSEEGHSVSREIALPNDVVPAGKALLLTPLPEEAPAIAPVDPSPTPSVSAHVGSAVAKPDARGPRTAHDGAPAPPSVLVGLLVSPRYAGKSELLLGGVAAQVAIPFGAWLAGGWARFDAVSTPPEGGHLREVCGGALFGRTLLREPVELRLSALGSVAVMMRSGREVEEATFVDGRGGLELRGVLPVTHRFRLAAAIDGELAPAQLGSDSRRDGDGSSRPLPSWTLGLGLGVELAL